MKKKPLLTRTHHQQGEGGGGGREEEHWVTAVAAYPNTDLVASGNEQGQFSFIQTSISGCVFS